MEYCEIDLFSDDATHHVNGNTKSEIEPISKQMAIILELGLSRIRCKYTSTKLHVWHPEHET